LRLHDYQAALPYFDALLRLQPDFGPGCAGRGASLDAMGDVEGAYDADRASLQYEYQHNNLAALSRLASLASRKGRHHEARVLAGRVLRAHAGHAGAETVLAQADIAEGQPNEAARRLRGIANPQASAAQKASAEIPMANISGSQRCTPQE
jgi:predicted Zn-dependent protease